jgi:hypothetical protein
MHPMKLKSLAVLSIIATVSFGLIKEVIAFQAVSQIPAVTNSTTQVAAAVGQSGDFQPGEHPTQGKVSVFAKNNKSYLQFDQNFKTDSGPDLVVILHRSDAPPIYGVKAKDYVLIAPLQKVAGSQTYVLPSNLNLSEYKSVAIWCRKFNATFGYATLSNQNN